MVVGIISPNSNSNDVEIGMNRKGSKWYFHGLILVVFGGNLNKRFTDILLHSFDDFN
jgi:hypothetical protein